MPRVGADTRRDEIIEACSRIYQVKGFNEVTIKAIAELTSFSRPSIYNYFETKEEIFLDLLTRECERWADKLEALPQEAGPWDRVRFTDALAWQWARGVASPIVGATKASYLDDAAGALDVKLSAEDVAYIEEPYVPHRIVGAIDHNPAEGVMLLDEKK